MEDALVEVKVVPRVAKANATTGTLYRSDGDRTALVFVIAVGYAVKKILGGRLTERKL